MPMSVAPPLLRHSVSNQVHLQIPQLVQHSWLPGLFMSLTLLLVSKHSVKEKYMDTTLASRRICNPSDPEFIAGNLHSVLLRELLHYDTYKVYKEEQELSHSGPK
ncbi:hypothetical protein V6N11_009406 [Hibiscus sabdariffa]|uniref:Uncharacterized protein n=1 Tax=Hibiscus sabdariffa TaxID=183260 RepID=A0ABR2NSS1_9ROSI